MWADGFLSATLGLLTLRNAQKSAFENFRFWTISWECPRVILGKVPDIKNQWIKTYLVFFLCVCVPAPNYIIYLNWRDVSPCSVGWLCSPSPPPKKKRGGHSQIISNHPRISKETDMEQVSDIHSAIEGPIYFTNGLVCFFSSSSAHTMVPAHFSDQTGIYLRGDRLLFSHMLNLFVGCWAVVGRSALIPHGLKAPTN